MSNLKQVAIDVDSWEILNEIKERLQKEGRNPSLSDAIRYLLHEEPTTDVWYWQCKHCGKTIASSYHDKIPLKPDECDQNQGGCGRVSDFDNVTIEVLRKKLHDMKDLDVELKVVKSHGKNKQ